MGEVPTTTNQTVGTVDKIIHAAIMGAAVEAAITAATAAAPWLGLPIIRNLFRWAVQYAAGFLSQYVEEAAAFAIIDAQTNAEAHAYQTAVTALKAAYGSGDAHALDTATLDFKKTLGDLIHYDGS